MDPEAGSTRETLVRWWLFLVAPGEHRSQLCEYHHRFLISAVDQIEVNQRYSSFGYYPAGMDREPVSSSLLRSVGYDSDQQLLEVELQDGKIYRYADVSEQIYHGLIEADSLGRYFNQHIRELSYSRVE